MAPKKGVGTFKGKQLARKALPKRPAIEISELENESDFEDQRIILEQLEALERVQGLSPRGPTPSSAGRWGWMMRQAAQKNFQVQMHNCSRK